MGKHEDASMAKISEIRRNIYKQCALAGAAVLLVLLLGIAFTSAWYTNVAYTSGLVFHIEEYGFLGEISGLPEESIAVYPGESGVITMNIQNDSALTLRANLSVSKVETLLEVDTIVDPQDDEVFYNMGEELQKRIYFYVDTDELVNGEAVGRSYVNTISSYEYLITPWGDVSIGEDLQDDSALYWYWVEDVLGYYVIATNPYEVTTYADTDEDGDGVYEAVSGAGSIQQYLQPIEYDYDTATFDEDGALLTVDGTTTADDFMQELKTQDGYLQSDWNGLYTDTLYQGLFEDSYAPADVTTYDEETGESTTTTSYGVYYPIDVDATGYGVWAYLCDETEIKAASLFDTMLITGSLSEDNENMMPCTATLSITGNPELLEETSVRTEAELRDAIDAGAPLIALAADIALENPLTLSGTVTEPAEDDTETQTITITENAVMIDLNGCTLSYEGSASEGDGSYAIYLDTRQALTLYNGTLAADTAIAIAVNGGGSLSLQQVDITDAGIGIWLSGDGYGTLETDDADVTTFAEDTTLPQARIVIEDSTITTSDYGVYLVGSEYTVQESASVYLADNVIIVAKSQDESTDEADADDETETTTETDTTNYNIYQHYAYGVQVNIESGLFSQSVATYLLANYAESIVTIDDVVYYKVAWVEPVETETDPSVDDEADASNADATDAT